MKYLGVKIPDELAKALEATGRPKSEVVREALEAYLGVEREIPYQDEIIKLIDERIAFYKGKTEVEHQVKPSKTTVKPKKNEGKTTVEPELNRGLQMIKDFHDREVEPTVAEVAEAVGMESRPLGRIMKEAGVQAVKCHRGGIQARRYTFELKERIEELIEKGELDGGDTVAD